MQLQARQYWNPHAPVQVRVTDDHALGAYRVTLTDGVKVVDLASGKFAEGVREAKLPVTIPEKTGLDPARAPWQLRVKIGDRSLWNFGRGNRAVATGKILVDREAPKVAVVSKSPSIVRGGSALLIFRAEDPHIKSVVVEAGGRRWKAIPYKEKGYYATLLAWPFRVGDFRVRIIAEDVAGNRTVSRVRFETVGKHYRSSWIGLSERFLKGKIAEVASQDPKAAGIRNPLKKFRAVNEGMRQANEKLIHEHTTQVTPVDFNTWRLRAFYPLKNAKRVADFGDERHYFYGSRDRSISLSYHLGYDLASVRQAPIVSSNPATVVFASYNGIYGNMPILDHGFGLYTLYGHCSSLQVAEGDEVRRGDVIARTGMTGLALGDHLHFGVLVQGTEVLPMDWMKQNWIKSHIDDVFRRADRVIARHSRS
ncbi:M23 family metallopeptidase [Nitratifractor sp.]